MKCDNCDGKGTVSFNRKARIERCCMICDGTGRTCDKCGEASEGDECEDCLNEAREGHE